MESHLVATYELEGAPKWGPALVYRRSFRADADRANVVANRFDGEVLKLVSQQRESAPGESSPLSLKEQLIAAELIPKQEFQALLARNRMAGSTHEQIKGVVSELVRHGLGYVLRFSKTLAIEIQELLMSGFSRNVEAELTPSTREFAAAWVLLAGREMNDSDIQYGAWLGGESLLNVGTAAYFELTGESAILDPAAVFAVCGDPEKATSDAVAGPSPGSLATTESVAARTAEWAATLERQKSSPSAPKVVREGDPWWNPATMRTWYSARMLFRDKVDFLEELWVFSLPKLAPNLPLPEGMTDESSAIKSFLTWIAHEAGAEPLAVDISTTAWHLNDLEVLSIKRRFGGTIGDYCATYVD